MSAKGFRKISTFGSRVTSVVSVCLVLILLGLAAMIGLTTRNISDDVRRNLGFTVIMDQESESADAETLAAAINARAGVDSVLFRSAEDILRQESAALGGDLALDPGVNPYSAEIEVRVRPDYANTDSIAALTAAFAQADGVGEIITENAVIAGVERSLTRVRTILLILAAVLLAVSIALINNTVSLSIYSKRFSIHTMKLVGATAAFIRRPFVRAGAVNGLVAGAAASALLCGLRVYGAVVEPALAVTLPWTGVAAICAVLLVLGTALCSLTACFAANRYIATSYDEMFLK